MTTRAWILGVIVIVLITVATIQWERAQEAQDLRNVPSSEVIIPSPVTPTKDIVPLPPPPPVDVPSDTPQIPVIEEKPETVVEGELKALERRVEMLQEDLSTAREQSKKQRKQLFEALGEK